MDRTSVDTAMVGSLCQPDWLIARTRPVEGEDLKFLRDDTDREVKITLPGPFTMGLQAQNDYHRSLAEAAMDHAAAVKAEMADPVAAGADIVQLHEPWLQAKPDLAED